VKRLLRFLADHRLIVATVVLVPTLAVGIAAYLHFRPKESKLTVGPGAAQGPSSGDGEQAENPKPPKPSVWPTYGFDAERTHRKRSRIRPPFRSVWRKRPTRRLIELPPSVAFGKLFLVDNAARVAAVSTKRGRTIWARKVGRLAASTPTWDRGRLFVAVLATGEDSDRGRVVALGANTGRVLWRKELPSRTESTPLVLGDRVYLGSEDGTVYALRRSNGKTVWTHRAPGGVKGALAYDRGRLYFGDYAGGVTALRARDGARAWYRSNVSTENFYGTPAVGFGRVYLTTTLGEVFAVTTSGQVSWKYRTGKYVYASPALANVRNRGPTLFVGSWDEKFYALDARTGRVRWARKTAGTINGAASVIGDYVYFSSYGGKVTYGLRARDGHEVFRWRQAAFTPAVSDGRQLYLIGYSTVRALVPKSAPRFASVRARLRAERRAERRLQRRVTESCFDVRHARLHERLEGIRGRVHRRWHRRIEHGCHVRAQRAVRRLRYRRVKHRCFDIRHRRLHREREGIRGRVHRREHRAIERSCKVAALRAVGAR
jgi:outer membrane protein assembly factor BamB